MTNNSSYIEIFDFNSVEYEEPNFGSFPRTVRQAKRILIHQFAKEVNKISIYLSDIENGHNKFLEKELLDTATLAAQLNKAFLCLENRQD